MMTYAMLTPALALLFLDSSSSLLAADNQMKHFIFGLFLSVYSLMQILALPLWAKASVRISHKNVLRWSYLGNCLGYGVGALGVKLGGISLLFAGSALAGLMGANLPTMQAMISQSSPRSEWSRHYSLLGAIIGASFVVGPQITGWSLHQLSSHEVCLGLYLLCSAVSAFNLLLINLIPDPQPEEQAATNSSLPPEKRLFSSPVFFAFSPELKQILLFQFCICMSWYSFIKFFQVYLLETLHCNKVWSCYGISYLGLCCTLWQGLRFSSNLGIFSHRLIFPLGLALMGGSFLGFMLIDSVLGVIIAVCCLACSYAMLVPSILALLISKGEMPTEYKTSAYQSVQALAKILAPLMAGFILSFTSLATALICTLLVAGAWGIFRSNPRGFSLEGS